MKATFISRKTCPPLLQRQGDDVAVGVALETDLGHDGLCDEDILVNGCDFERPLVGALRSRNPNVTRCLQAAISSTAGLERDIHQLPV